MMLSKRMASAISVFVICVMATGCFRSKNEVKKIPPVDGKLVKLDGVPYALPRTVVRVRVPFKRTDKTPGRMQEFAPCFFPPDVAAGRVTAKATTFAIQPATFSSRGEPDPSEHYIAKIKGGLFENKTMELAFNSDGVITKGDASSENVAIDVAIKAARTVVSVAAKALTPAAAALDAKARAERGDEEAAALTDICRSQVVAAAAASAAEAARAAADAARAAADALADEAAAVEKAAIAAGTSQRPDVKAQIDAAKKRAKDADDYARAALKNAEDAANMVELIRREIAAAGEQFEGAVRELDAAVGDLRSLSAPFTQLPGGSQPTAPKSNESRAKELEVRDSVSSARDRVRSAGSSLVQQVIDYAATDCGSVRHYVEQAAENASKAASSAADAAEAARAAASAINAKITFVGGDVCDCGCRCKSTSDEQRRCLEESACTSRREECERRTNLLARAFSGDYAEAKKVFEHIKELKDKRETLASGESAPQGVSADGIKLMLDELDKTINSYQNSFFLGTSDSDDWTADFEFTPGKSVISADSFNAAQSSPALFLFSKADGLCETFETKRQGVLIKPAFKADKCKPDHDGNFRKGFEAVWLAVSRLSSDDGYLNHIAKANERDEQDGARGFYYRIPARAVVKLEKGTLCPDEKKCSQGRLRQAHIDHLDEVSERGRRWRTSGYDEPAPASEPLPNGRELARDSMRVAQLGVTGSLPASAAGRKTQYTIDFDETTGAMKNFKLASNALLEKSLVEEAGGAAEDIVAAKQARDKARADKADPLNQKKRELELLQTENAINEEKKKLAGAQPEPTPEPEEPEDEP